MHVMNHVVMAGPVSHSHAVMVHAGVETHARARWSTGPRRTELWDKTESGERPNLHGEMAVEGRT